MSNLLKAEFYKLFHSWYFWGIGLFNLLLSSVLLLDSVGETSNLFFASIYNMPILYFLTIIFSALFVGNDFGGRTLQSYINAGHRRGKILFAKLVVHQIACMVILSFPLLLHSIIGTFVTKGALASIGIVVMVIASQFAMCLLPFFFAFIFRDIGKSMAVPMVLFFLIIKNEKYKGDILMGKTFTLDPISKRRLDNFGEEDQFYIRDHHEAIISEEMFEKAQEILKRRAKPRRLGTDGKREKFSRKYAFSCMLECGFCGGTLTRRSWHSGSQYNKVIWQCVTATKKGKKFCPDSKGIAEETIEQAFIESYRLLCQNNKDVLDEFIARTEETLSDSNASKQLAKVEKDIAALDAKRAKLVDMRLEEIIDKETYEQKYFDLSSQIEQLQKQRESLQESAETESTMKKRIAEFRRTLEENEVLDTFDRYVFESIVEKVIVGGYDEDGNKDPAMLTFIYKTGFKNSLDGTNFKPPRKNSKAAKQNACLCSHTTDEAKSMCSYHSDDTRGVRTSNDP